MRGATLGARIFAAIAAILAVLVLLTALYGQHRIRAYHDVEVTRRLGTAAALLEDRARAWLAGEVSPEDVRREVQSFRLEGELRVTVIAASGEVLADNAARLPLENHGQRPEVLQALREGTGSYERTSASTGIATLYHARRVDRRGEVLGYVRVAEPLHHVEAEIAALRSALGIGAGVVLVLGLAVSALLAARIARPLREMEEAAARIASGGLGERVRVAGPEEVGRLAGSLNRMAEEIRGRIEAERRARSELESVLAGMVEGVVAVDAGERILFMNGAAARLLGLRAPLPPGAALWESVRFPDMEAAVRAALAGRTPERGDSASPAADGRTLEIGAGPLGGGSGAVAILRDVTEVRRLERIRMDFVANVSHELRTPLAGVAGALETLEADDLDPAERRKFHDIARRNTERLQALVADLLDLSAIESEGTSLPLERLNLSVPVRSSAASLSGLASERGVTLTVDGASADLPVLGNARRLEQAFVNLVENALKYTPAGGRVAVRVLDRGSEAAVEVEDSGVGIPAEALPRIFERFYRVDPSRSRQMGGTGLGLAIVKHVVRAHRGRVEVRSVEGAGTTFTVVLPSASAS